MTTMFSILSLTRWTLLGWTTLGWLEAVETRFPDYEGVPLISSLTVDGHLNDWPAGAKSALGLHGPTETSCSAWVYKGWDREFLYIGVEVFDDVILLGEDGLDLFLDVRDPSLRERKGYAAGVFCLRLKWESTGFKWSEIRGQNAKAVQERAKVYAGQGEGSWRGELAVPWEALGVAPEADFVLNFGLTILDGDSPDFPAVPAIGLLAPNASNSPYSEPITFDSIRLIQQDAPAFSWSCREEVVDEKPLLIFRCVASREETLPRALRVSSNRGGESMRLEAEPSLSGRFAWIEKRIPLQPFGKPGPLSFEIQRETGEWDLIANFSPVIWPEVSRVVEKLPPSRRLELPPGRRDHWSYYRELAFEVVGEMSVEPNANRVRQRQLRALRDKLHYRNLIDFYISLAEDIESGPERDYLFDMHQVWRSQTDDSLQMFKLRRPVLMSDQDTRLCEIVFHPEIESAERFRFPLDVLRIEANRTALNTGRHLRVDLFGKGNSFYPGSRDEYRQAVDLVGSDQGGRRGLILVGASEGAVSALLMAIDQPAGIVGLDLRGGNFRRLLDEHEVIFPGGLRAHLSALKGTAIRLAYGENDQGPLETGIRLKALMEAAGLRVELVKVKGAGHNFFVIPLSDQLIDGGHNVSQTVQSWQREFPGISTKWAPLDSEFIVIIGTADKGLASRELRAQRVVDRYVGTRPGQISGGIIPVYYDHEFTDVTSPKSIWLIGCPADNTPAASILGEDTTRVWMADARSAFSRSSLAGALLFHGFHRTKEGRHILFEDGNCGPAFFAPIEPDDMTQTGVFQVDGLENNFIPWDSLPKL